MENKIINGKCPNCGSILKYDPDTNMIKCESCDSTFPIESLGKGNLDDEELDFQQALENSNLKLTKRHVKNIKCQDCGATIIFKEGEISSKCPFCGSTKTLVKEEDEDVVPILGVIPFKTTNKDCNDCFKSFIKSKLFAPSKFKKEEHYPTFNPIYMPLYTFDANTFTIYSGQKGIYEEVQIVNKDQQGNEYITSESQLNWYPISGTYSYDFEDVLVIGNRQKNYYYIEKVSEFNFNEMEKFNEQFLLGYNAQRCSLPIDRGFDEAKYKMESSISNGIKLKINANQVEFDILNTHYSDVTFKQVLVPIYNGIYTYNNKKYRFVINGQTGSCYGDYPISGFKIALLVLGVILVIALVIFIYYYQGN